MTAVLVNPHQILGVVVPPKDSQGFRRQFQADGMHGMYFGKHTFV